MLDLTKSNPSLKRVRGVLSWDESPIHAKSLVEGFDLDIFAFITSGGKMTIPTDVAYFKNKSPYGGAVSIPRDNRTGEGDNDEEIFIEFDKVPSDKDAIELFVFIFDYEKRQQNFSMMQNSFFKLFDADTGTLIQAYSLQQFATGSALHVGTLKRTGSEWGFQPVGDSAQADPNDVIVAYM